MASDKQIAAIRTHAHQRTSEYTPANRAISSQNALRTGLDSKSDVMRRESQTDYETLIAEFYERFHPTVPEERCLVDMLIQSEWQSRRYMSLDASVWESGFVETNSKTLGRVFLMSEEALTRVDRRLNSAQRNFQSALKQLMNVRTNRAR